MTTKFSQFIDGGVPRVTDTVVGLRGGNNTQFTSFTGVDDSVGNPIVVWQPGLVGTNINYVQIQSASSGNAPSITAQGGDLNQNLNIAALGSGHVEFIGTGAIGLPNGTTGQQPPGFAGAIRYNTTTGYLEYWTTSTNQWVEVINGAGPSNLTYVTNTNETAFLPNSQNLSALSTGIAYVTTTTGIIGSRTLTGTTNEITISNGTGSGGNPTFSLPSTLIAPGTFAATTSVSAPEYLLTGASSGTISILPQANAGTYNFNMPITAGTSGYVLTSAGGGSSPMTWTNLGSATVTSISGTANEITASASTGAVTLSIPSTFIAPGTIAATTSVSAPEYLLTGSGSGTITIIGQAAAGTYNFNMPTTAGTSGYFLTSAGGGSSAMTWTAPSSVSITIDGDSGAMSGNTLTISGGTTGLTTSASSATMNLTGILKLSNGGTNANLTASNGGIFYSTASAGAILNGTATAQQLLLSGASTTPQWSTSTYPLTNAANTLLYASSANVMAALATANSATMYTNSSGVPAWTASMTNGQLLIGNTGASPTPATLTAGTNVTITNGGGSITINSTATGGYATVNQNTSSATLANGNIYICNNGASLITFTLPASAAVGDRYEIVGGSSGGWTIAQNSGQTIHSNSSATTTGATGTLSSSNQYNGVTIYCVVANTTFAAIANGSLTPV